MAGKITYDEFGPVYDDDDPNENTHNVLKKPINKGYNTDIDFFDDSEDFNDISFAEDIEAPSQILNGDAKEKIKNLNKEVTAESRPFSNFRPEPH